MKWRLLSILLIPYLSLAQTPEWVNYQSREARYSSDTYFKGFISRSYSQEENLSDVEEEVLTYSRIRLSESVRISIKSVTSNQLTNTNASSDEVFRKNSVTRTELIASGLQSNTWFDKRKKVAYGFAYVNKQELMNYYQTACAGKLAAVGLAIDSERASSEPSLQNLMAISNDLEQTGDLLNMMRFLGKMDSAVFEEWWSLQRWTADQLEQLIGGGAISLDEASTYLVEQLFSATTKENTKQLRVKPVTFKNTGVVTEFSHLFENHLIKALSGKVTVSDNENGWVLNGTYWPVDDKVRLMVTIHNSEEGELLELVAAGSVEVKKDQLEELAVAWIPDIDKSQEGSHQAITNGDPATDFVVSLTTQKGNEAVSFAEGEILKLKVKVSRPAYIQLINVWADGSQLLMLDNHYLDSTMINRYVELPFSWETACPCGVEYITVRATDKRQPKLNTEMNDGFEFILDPISEVLEKQRGFKRREDYEYIGETSLVLATFQGN